MTVEYCFHCGARTATGGHARCRDALQFEPPRYCGQCGRRMVVQVTPGGWTGRCSAHGPVAAAPDGESAGTGLQAGGPGARDS